ncbi:MAG: hypothetical protein RI957_255 [Verrucomicrobiota bacterium]|jgi:sialate O-acetylesterase
MQQTWLALVSFALFSQLLAAEQSMRVSSLFCDHMVLQREQEVPVWGHASPGDEISVVFADQKKSTICNPEGHWMLRLSALMASRESRELSVSSKKENRTVRISDVVVGDVWLCSGQSNMHFRMAGVENAKAEIAAAHQPLLRFFTVGEQLAQAPAHDVAGKWQGATADTIASCSAVAYYFGAALQKKSDLPIGLLVSSVGGTRIESWMRPETIAATGESRSLVDQWKKISADEFQKIAAEYRAFQYQRDHAHPHQVSAARAKGEPIPPAPKQPRTRCHDCPSSLHHGMIAPLQPFAIRGVIWYQGESNSSQPKSYEKLLPAMIADWRQAWGKEMPFLFVQLASYRDTHPAFRLAQQRIWQKTARTAMVVTTDVGDAANIHPTRKRPVGERLALAARAIGEGESVEYSGPLFDNMKIQGDRVIISFSHCGSGLVAKGGELTGFTVAGKEQKFFPAKASIDGNSVVVTCDKISNPIAVRYNWAKMAEGNLYNREGLPACTLSSGDPTQAP